MANQNTPIGERACFHWNQIAEICGCYVRDEDGRYHTNNNVSLLTGDCHRKIMRHLIGLVNELTTSEKDSVA
jgi:hypothetical protein